MHRVFLREVLEQIGRKEAELEELRTVANYHAAMAEIVRQELAEEQNEEKKAENPPKEKEVPPARVDPKLKKRDAALKALRALGGRAATAQICNWLTQRGYGRNLKRNIFYNGIFTAMKRSEQDFRRTANGEWELTETPEETDKNGQAEE